MLKLNLRKIASMRGIKNISIEMQRHGIKHYTASRYNRGMMAHFKLEHIEKLCLMMNCTPDDLLEWIPDKTLENAPDIALNKLKHQEVFDFMEMSKNIPLDKLPELKKMCDELRNKK